MAHEAARLTDRWALVFSDSESSHIWRASLQASGDRELELAFLLAEAEASPAPECAHGLEYIRTIFWDKLSGSPQFTGDRPAVACEAITVMHAKGSAPRWNGGGKRGIYAVATVLDRGGGRGGIEPRLHTTQKPKGLLLALEEDFTDPERAIAGATASASLIYDFTAGVCTSGAAAIDAEGGPRFWVGCELDPLVDLDECKHCGREAADHGHPFASRKRGGDADVCKVCGVRRVDHGSHDFEPVRSRVWADRGATRLDAALSGSTYSARRSGQLSLMDRMVQ